MTIIYNIAARKPFVKAISEITGEPSKYMFTPTYSYQIGDFTVTREGNLEFDDMTDSELVEKVIEELDNLGYHAEPAVGERDTVEVEAEPEIEDNKAAGGEQDDPAVGERDTVEVEVPVAEVDSDAPATDGEVKPENEAHMAEAESDNDNHIAEATDNGVSNSNGQVDIEPDVDNSSSNQCENANMGGTAGINANMGGTAEDNANLVCNAGANANQGGTAGTNDNLGGTAGDNGIEIGHTADSEPPVAEANSGDAYINEGNCANTNVETTAEPKIDLPADAIEPRTEVPTVEPEPGLEVPAIEVNPNIDPEVDHFTVQFSRDSFTTLQLTNLKKLVAAKAPLLKQAIGCDELPIIITDDRVSFPWFAGNLDADTCIAYTTLVSSICTMAKEAKRVTAKEKDLENPKYAFRCFLLRLGFIGDEYKRSRKILMKNFTGSGAFKSGGKK